MSSTETFHVTQEIEGDECIVGTCERFANAVIMARAEVKLGQVGICVTSTTRGILVVYDKDGRETLGRPVTAEEKAAVADTASRCLRGGDPS